MTKKQLDDYAKYNYDDIVTVVICLDNWFHNQAEEELKEEYPKLYKEFVFNGQFMDHVTYSTKIKKKYTTADKFGNISITKIYR